MKALMGLDKKFYAPFLDDVAIFSQTFDKHVEHLYQVLSAQRQAGMTLQPKKCQFFQDEINFLGHTISKEGIGMNKDYVEVIKEWPIPQTIEELRTFLGKTGYYRKFVKDYAAIACPLMNMVNKESVSRKKEKMQLTELQLRAFSKLKDALTTAPILTFANFHSDEPFILDTDWSNNPGAIGGVLSQKQNGVEKVICFGARKLNKAEMAYPPTKGELLAAIHFIKLWKFFLWPRKFVLRTDHKALKWIYSMEHPTGMTMRWLETLSNHDFEVEYREGKLHSNADALSRITHAKTEEPTDDWSVQALTSKPDATNDDNCDTAKGILKEEFDSSMANDSNLMLVKQWLKTSIPEKAEMKKMPRDLKRYWSIARMLRLHDGKIYLQWKHPSGEDTQRLCVPTDIQGTIIREFHGEAHFGIDSTYNLMCKRFFFPGLRTKIAEVINRCRICQAKRGQMKSQMHTHRDVMATNKWEKL